MKNNINEISIIELLFKTSPRRNTMKGTKYDTIGIHQTLKYLKMGFFIFSKFNLAI
ncbi:hypothetical protein T190423A01A_10258 [Tenacibaculum sp. 190130A14a]|uniref:Uncharacterized protein n=1 Tax=Tenacibaculum polynesiense TaxID=3137857 RepID=A0ABM9P875_9FLAO